MKNFFAAVAFVLLSVALFSQGTYIEMKLSSPGNAGVSGTFKTYNQDNDMRTEMKMAVPQMPGGAMNMVMLKLKSSENTVYLLDEKEKTYSEFSTSTTDDYKDYQQSEYEVTVLGKEKVNGYNATHVRIKVKGHNYEQEMWTSTEIANYANFNSVKSKYWGKDNLTKALTAKGAQGFPVRILVNENRQKVQMDLVKAEMRNNPSSLFSLKGYNKQSGAGMPGGVDMQELIEQMKNATPEEREEMIKQMQKMYGQPH